MSRGRGQPPKIEAHRYEELLTHLRAGLPMHAIAQEMGVTRATLYNLARRDEAMGARMAEARQAARDAHTPSESCYVNNRCRQPECIAAASEARAQRRTPVAAPAAEARIAAAVRPTVYELLADEPPPLANTA